MISIDIIASLFPLKIEFTLHGEYDKAFSKFPMAFKAKKNYELEESESESESEVAQSCPTLCYPMDCSLSGSSVHGIFQARVLEWVAISSPGNLPNPGIKPGSPTLQADALPSEPISIQVCFKLG